jgi:hypothetical protein
MKCPKCGSTWVGITADLNRCEECDCRWTTSQQAEIERLREQVAKKNARIMELESQLWEPEPETLVPPTIAPIQRESVYANYRAIMLDKLVEYEGRIAVLEDTLKKIENACIEGRTAEPDYIYSNIGRVKLFVPNALINKILKIARRGLESKKQDVCKKYQSRIAALEAALRETEDLN